MAAGPYCLDEELPWSASDLKYISRPFVLNSKLFRDN